MTKRIIFGVMAALAASAGLSAPAAAQYQNEIRHSVAPCQGSGPAVWINVTDIASSRGTLRVQLYRGTRADWLEHGRWLNRIELPARAGSMPNPPSCATIASPSPSRRSALSAE